MGEIVAIVGSRKYPREQDVVDYVNSLPQNTLIVSGGAPGVDTIAIQAARARKMHVKILPAEWSRYGKGAGLKRNVDIVECVTRVVAFWDERSTGTRHMITVAQEMGRPVEVLTPRLLELRRTVHNDHR